MNLRYENQGTHTYLVYAIAEDDIIDTLSLGMLTNNKIPGLTNTLYTQMDNDRFIKYDVSAKISVKQFFAGQVNKKRLLGVFNGIMKAMLSAEEYMIDPNTILFDLEYMFVDVSTCDTVLICLPIVSSDAKQNDFGIFFKNIMFSTQFDQTENCNHVAKIINYLNSAPVFSINEFKKVLDTLSADSAHPQGTAMSNTVMSNPGMQKSMQQSSLETTQFSQQKTIQNNNGTNSYQPIYTQAPPTQNVTNNKNSTQQPTPEQPNSQDKKMTMFGLMMNYSKENAALYKAQKKSGKKTQDEQDLHVNINGNTGFNIPGQAPKPNNQNFAVPGQTPKPNNQGFAVPGQTPKPNNQGFVIPNQAPRGSNQSFANSNQPRQNNNQGIPTANYASPQVTPAAKSPSYIPQQQSFSVNFGETTVLGGGGIGETTVLGATSTITSFKPYLLRTKNSEKIILDKPVFRIGKEKSYVDYFIGDNAAISRSHANVIVRDGDCFVVDTNSTNHTYVNGVMLQSNVEKKLTHGDKVRLANEDFEFKLY